MCRPARLHTGIVHSIAAHWHRQWRATFNFPTGMFQWGGGRIDVSAGSLTNAGALTLTGSGTQDLSGTLTSTMP